MTARVAELVRSLGLAPHPEGGYYREIYRSSQTVRPSHERAERSAITTIYYLLPATDHSRWHSVRSDEVWHFYDGDPLELTIIEPGTFELRRARLGPMSADQRPARVVPAGHWQAARTTGAYTLAGCSVGPGFDFADFRLLRDDPDAARRLRGAAPELAGLL